MPHRKKSTQQQRQWRRMDLHLHTPASIDYKQPNVTYLDLLKKAEEKKLDIISFTDHNSVNGYARYLEEVESLELLERLGRLRDDERARLDEYRRLRSRILILPGFEFTATLGFHILGIFAPDTTVRELEHLLLLLRVPPDKLDQGSGEVGATTDALTAYRMIHDAGGLVVAAHANSSHGVAMPSFDFGGQTRIAYTQDPNLDALEVTDLESRSRRRTAAFFSGTKPEYPRRMHCIQSSDSHKLDFDPRYKNEMGVGDRATEIFLDDLEFEAIQQVFQGSDFSRTRPYRPETEEPFDPIREAREQGDNLVQSFHERFHEKRGIVRSILEDAVALANTNGGTIYIGVSSNPKASVLGVEKPEQSSAELRSAVSKEITPPLEVQVDIIKSQSKNLLQVIVPRGSDVPYALEGTYIYVRSENETGLAVRDEIVQLVRDALAVELAASAATRAPAERVSPGEEQPVQAAVEHAPAGAISTVEPPRTGVEIVSSEQRKGVTYYSVRDLRNNRIVQNVTRASARRLWQYAIEEQEKHPCDKDKVAWVGNIGVCKSQKRGGKTRFDLVQRGNGKLFVYYGVTEDGIHGEWRKLVESENGAEEGTEEQQAFDTLGEHASPPASEGEDTQSVTLPNLQEQMALGAEPKSQSELDESPSVLPDGELVSGEDEEIRDQVRLLSAGPDTSASPELAETNRQQESHTQASNEEQRVGGVDKDQAAEQRTPEPPEQPAPTLPSSPQPAAPKSRAQQWREILDRALAEAHATQQAGGKSESASSGSSEENQEQSSPTPSSTADHEGRREHDSTEHERGQWTGSGDNPHSGI